MQFTRNACCILWFSIKCSPNPVCAPHSSVDASSFWQTSVRYTLKVLHAQWDYWAEQHYCQTQLVCVYALFVRLEHTYNLSTNTFPSYWQFHPKTYAPSTMYHSFILAKLSIDNIINICTVHSSYGPNRKAIQNSRTHMHTSHYISSIYFWLGVLSIGS